MSVGGEPAEAALAVARRLGVEALEAEVLQTGTHVLVRLNPGPVAARVTGDGIFAAFAGDLDAEVRVAAALHARGAPVIPPLADVPACVHEHSGRRVTLWEWWERPDADGAPEAAGRSLAACHRALVGVEVSLRPWTKLEEARSGLPRLAPAERALLATHLESPDGPLRPIHGDAHAGNVLPGPAWHDWEDAQLGWVEWDLACLVAPGRVLGVDLGHGEAILAAYDGPYDEARRCSRLHGGPVGERRPHPLCAEAGVSRRTRRSAGRASKRQRGEASFRVRCCRSSEAAIGSCRGARARELIVQHRRVGDPDDHAFQRLQPRDRLTPRLLARGMQKLVAGLTQIVCRRADRRRVGDVELDADLRNRPLSWPLSGPEASLGRLRQRPHAEALAPADLLAVVVPIAAEALER